MADGVSVSSLKSQQRLSKQNPPPSPTNFRSHFLLRALIAFFFFIVIPVLPSVAPEFFNQNLFSQSWELLHIVFVGIAVSYGLFSRRYDDSGGEFPPKSDTAQSYVSRLLQASSVFDDDVDSPTSSSFDDGRSKVQTWSSQYFRNEPVVVVANKKQSSVIRDDDHKPLLLPVRSLKSRVLDENGGADNSRGSGRSHARSRSYSSSSAQKEPSNWEKKIRNGSLKSRASDFSNFSGHLGSNSGFSGSDPNSSPDMSKETVNEQESVVLPSPIPWRSRSGRLEKKEDNPPMEEVDPNPSKWTSKALPMKAFPAPACLFESPSKRSDDLARKKTVYRSSAPPPPPPPPPPMAFYNKPSLVKSKALIADHGNEASSWEDSRRRSSSSSCWSEPEELSAGVKERSKLDYSSSGKSCRTIRSTRSWNEAAEEEEGEEEPIVTQKADELTHNENSFPYDYMNEGEHDFLGEVQAMSDDYDDEDEFRDEAADEIRELEKPENGKEESAIAGTSSFPNGVDDDGPPDVDKKADEFIAKFREQIRLQRIESIKRSTGQFSRSSVE